MSASAPSQPSYSELALHSIECSPRDHISRGNPFSTPDLNHRVREYLNELTRVRESPVKRSINQGKKDGTTITHMPTTIRNYDCSDCSRLNSQTFPLTVVLPATSNTFEHVACIPAVSRTVQSWIQVLPWNEPADKWSNSPKSRRLQWGKRHLLAAGYHMHETVRALRALPETMRCLVRDTPLLMKDSALKLASIIQQLGEREEKEPGVVVRLACSVPSLARVQGGLDDWEVKGPGSAALRRSWAEATRLRVAMWKLISEVREGVDGLERELGTLRDMAAVVLLELENGIKSPDWMVCERCTKNVLLVLRETVRSLADVRVVLRADSRATEDIARGKDYSIVGPLEWGPYNMRGFKDTTRQANELAQHMADIMSRVSLWSEVINGVQRGFQEWELYGEP